MYKPYQCQILKTVKYSGCDKFQNRSQIKQIFFIDFGLSAVSTKIEDKAVDLHLLKQALESKHYTIWEKCYKAALDEYKKLFEPYERV